MPMNYKKLFHLLVDKDLKEGEFRRLADISAPTLAKLRMGDTITTDMLCKICSALNVQPGDIMEYEPIPVRYSGIVKPFEIFSDDFISQNTQYKTFIELLSAAGITLKGKNDDELLKESMQLVSKKNRKLNSFIRNNTRFNNWISMEIAATKYFYDKNIDNLSKKDNPSDKE